MVARADGQTNFLMGRPLARLAGEIRRLLVFMSYPGSKGQSGVAERIIGQMPPHEIYVEAFFGSGVVFKAKRHAKISYLIDRDESCLAGHCSQSPLVVTASGDAMEFLPDLALPGDSVVYCDPPYVLSTRKGREYYDHEMSDAQHLALLQVLKKLKCNVLLSGYPSELYGRELQDWRCISYRTRTRGRTLTECLWCNFPEPTELHDWRYAGKNFRQRVTFKRLAARWLGRLEAMPPMKRGYLLNAIEQRRPVTLPAEKL